METDPIILFGIILLCAYLMSSYFSMVKIIFALIDRNSVPTDNEKLRYLVSKIETVLENKKLFSSIVAFGKTLSNVIITISIIELTPLIFTNNNFTYMHHISISLSAAIFIMAVLAYAIPRAIALSKYRSLLQVTHIFYTIMHFVLYPFAQLILHSNNLFLRLFKYDERFSFLSTEEISRLNDTTETNLNLDIEEKQMIRGVLELSETTANEIMVPRIDVKGLDIESDFKTALVAIADFGHSRIPVYRESIDSIQGILYAKDILAWISETPDERHSEIWNLENIIKPAYFIPISKKVDDLMADLKKNKIHMAVIVDEYGGTAGIVTLEDIIEEIVGEIHDEYDTNEDPIIEISENKFIVDAHIELDDLFEKLQISINLEDEDYNTLSGLFYHEYGEVPKEGSKLNFNGLKLRVTKMDRQRIEKIELTILTLDSPVDLKESF